MIKLIQPKTNTVREVPVSHQNKIRILRRAGFVNFDTYRAPKPPEVVIEPSLAEAVEKNKVDPKDTESEGSEPEIAIHISSAARNMVEKNDLDPAKIEGTGKDGQITKPDVKDYLKALKEEAEEFAAASDGHDAAKEETAPEEPESAEDIVTHDNAPDAGEAPETAPRDEPVVRPATEEEEAVEKAMRDAAVNVAEEETELMGEGKYPPSQEKRAKDFGPGQDKKVE